MRSCPHCGKDLPRIYERNGSRIIEEFFKEMGGIEKFSRDLARDYDDSTGHRRLLYQGKVLQLVESEDRARSRQVELDQIAQSQERAIMLEHALYLIETDESFRQKLLEVAEKRDVLSEDVIETELA